MALTRRTFFKSTLATAVVIPFTGCNTKSDIATGDITQGAFKHGVASGDPLSDRVILWTRFTPPSNTDITENIRVTWQISTDQIFQQIVSQGAVYASQAKDYTVKADVTGLAPYTTYYYRFSVGTLVSSTGRTKTLPVGDVKQAKIAFLSCADYDYGYFNVYGRVAEYLDLDVVLHLGDYIYEYGNDTTYRDASLTDRAHQPAWEIVTLSDYRTRHAQYKTDVDLQNAHAAHPFICVWDDHDFADNAYHNGAVDHQSAVEGSWSTRSMAAKQAYLEWLPIRENDMTAQSKIYREFRFGNLVNLDMLDTRYIGRDQQVTLDGSQNNQARTLLGLEQESWLTQRLIQAKQDSVVWNVLGQQVMFMQMKHAGQFGNNDQWDGYAAARTRLLDILEQNAIDNVVILTGDVHSSWIGEVSKNPYEETFYDKDTGKGSLAVEFVVTSVTSPAQDLNGGELKPDPKIAYALLQENPHLRWGNIDYRGFATLTITPDNVISDYIFVPAVNTKTKEYALAISFEVKKGEARVLNYTRTQTTPTTTPTSIPTTTS